MPYWAHDAASIARGMQMTACLLFVSVQANGRIDQVLLGKARTAS